MPEYSWDANLVMPDRGIQTWMEPKSEEELKECANLDEVYDDRIIDRTRLYKVTEDYYDGEHHTRVLDRAKVILEAHGIPFSENFCDIIVDVMSDRMKIDSFLVSGSEENSEIYQQIEDIWTRNEGPEEEGVTHTQCFIKGDGFVIVSADKNGARFEFNKPDCIKCVYSSENPRLIEYAVKVWCQNTVSELNPSGSDIIRMNVYYDNRVEKYFQVNKGGHWLPYYDDGDAYWPVPWTENFKPNGVPLGIPVIHFSNKPKGRKYGRSEIRKAIPMQDGYNKALLDVFEIIDVQGFPQRWGTGIGKEQAAKLLTTPGSLWAIKNTDAKFGQFEAADLDKVGRMLERKLRNVAALTQTPVHMLFFGTGDSPSGETIRASEAGLVSKVRDRQPGFGASWSRVMKLCLKLDNIILSTPDLGDGVLSVHWSNPETASLTDLLNSAMIKQQLGVSKLTILRELGYDNPEEELAISEEEAARIMERNHRFTQAGGIPQVQYDQ